MSRFIRDKGDKKREEVMELFDMAEFCQVFLTAHYIRNDDESYIPLIQRGKLDRMPKEVAEEMDNMFILAVKELEKMGDDPETFMKRARELDYDPVSDYIDTPEMKNALGNVIMRRLKISEGIHDEDEAYERAKELMPTVRDAMHQFVALNLSQAMHNIVEELAKRGVKDLSQVSTLINPRVAMIDDQGIGFSAEIDKDALDEWLSKSSKTEEKKVKYDPAWG
jgi:hypothetical protein|tara:strand:- start:39 stop:707 length:669 start_codon:yes stop_codon:yes gene_type:complete